MAAAAVSAQESCLEVCVRDNVNQGINNQMVLNALCKFKCHLKDTKELVYRVADYLKNILKEQISSKQTEEKKENLSEKTEQQPILQKEVHPQEEPNKLPERPICRMGPSKIDTVKREQVKEELMLPAKETQQKENEEVVVINKDQPQIAVCPVSFETKPQTETKQEQQVEEKTPEGPNPSGVALNNIRKKIINHPVIGSRHIREPKHLSEAKDSMFGERIRIHRDMMKMMVKKTHEMQKKMLGRHMYIMRFMNGGRHHGRHHHAKHHGLGHHLSPGYGHNRHNPFNHFFKKRGHF